MFRNHVSQKKEKTFNKENREAAPRWLSKYDDSFDSHLILSLKYTKTQLTELQKKKKLIMYTKTQFIVDYNNKIIISPF